MHNVPSVRSYGLALFAPLSLLIISGCSESSSKVRFQTDPEIEAMVSNVSAQRIEHDIRTLAGFGTRHTQSETESDTRGIGAARRWIKRQFEQIAERTDGRMTVQAVGKTLQPSARRITAPTEVINLVATLRGTQPKSADRVYVVSGHYDSICSDPTDFTCDAPGANDDASGTAAVIEMARVMSEHDFDATIVFMAVAGEEQGLHGSRHMAEWFRSRHAQIAGMITNDIIGNSVSQLGVRDDTRVRVFSEGVPEIETDAETKLRLAAGSENDSPARQLARYMHRACDQYVDDFDVMLIFRRDRLMRGGDHTSFSRAGYPAVRFTEPAEDYRHQHQNVRFEDGVQYGDLPEFVDFEYTARVTQVNVAALAELARAPAVPRNVRLMMDKLSPYTTLKWDRGDEPDLVGYEVLCRATTSPTWDYSIDVGDVTEFTTDVSKDNAFFAVRAVDQDGHRSVAVFAQPYRP